MEEREIDFGRIGMLSIRADLRQRKTSPAKCKRLKAQHDLSIFSAGWIATKNHRAGDGDGLTVAL